MTTLWRGRWEERKEVVRLLCVATCASAGQPCLQRRLARRRPLQANDRLAELRDRNATLAPRRATQNAGPCLWQSPPGRRAERARQPDGCSLRQHALALPGFELRLLDDVLFQRNHDRREILLLLLGNLE